MVRKKKVRYEPQANLVPKREDPGNEVGLMFLPHFDGLCTLSVHKHGQTESIHFKLILVLFSFISVIPYKITTVFKNRHRDDLREDKNLSG